MTFLYPSFLWALGVLSIPVIIHLFNFRKTTKVYFSNTRFLKHVKESTTAKRKLKHYLILASRLLFLFFLVIAFCQPMLPAKDEQVNYHNVVFYLDNSQSMSAPLADRTRALDAGVTFITRIIETFPLDSRYKLITNDFAPFSNTFKTKAEMQELLSQIRLSPVSRTVAEIKDRIIRNEAIRDQEIFWVSDFQRSTAGRISNTPADSAFRWHLVPIRLDALSNVFVDTVYLENPFASSGEKNVLRIKVRNEGTQVVDQLSTRLTINGVQAGTTTIDVPAGGVNEATFDLTTRLSGLNRAAFIFNDFPVSFDNEFFFTLNFKEKIHIVEVKTTPNVTPVQNVYGNSQIFSYRGFSIGNFNYSNLNEADLVILNGVNSIDPSLSGALQEYLRKGGSVFIIPGREPEIGSLKSFLQLPVLNHANGKILQDLEKPDFNNPFFENVFEEKSNAVVMPRATQLLDWGNDRSAILKYKTDKPFLSRFTHEGTIYLMATALESGFSDFYNHALFVPVMYRMASGSKKNEQKLYYTLNQNLLALRLDSLKTDDPVRMIGEEEIIPSQRRIGNQIILDLPKFTLKTGFYKIVAQKDTVDLVAFNPSKAESLLAQFNNEESKAFFANGEGVSIFDASNTETFSKEIKERYLGTPLWKYAIILALLFLLAEVLLIRFLK
jgi:hypothetical protein